MYFSKVTFINAREAAQKLVDLNRNGAYASHALLWALFDHDDGAHFLFREEEGAVGLPVFYVLSNRLPESSSLFLCESKSYQPRLMAGDRLAFKLRANPTISVRDVNGQSRRHDVLMHAKKQVDTTGMSLQEARDAKNAAALQAGTAWLADHQRLAGWGIQLDSEPVIDIESYRQQKLFQPKNKHHIQFSSVDYQGLLTVSDPAHFLEALSNGVGRAKGFGCGMWMIRRI